MGAKIKKKQKKRERVRKRIARIDFNYEAGYAKTNQIVIKYLNI